MGWSNKKNDILIRKVAYIELEKTGNIDWFIDISVRNGVEETKKDRPTQNITGGAEDNYKRNQVQFLSH